MKFEKEKSEAIFVGDIESNAVSIDVDNIDFIVTILSTNLYSNAIGSFIRETCSNAWDSHVEAGIDKPIILELGKDTEDNYFCRIQDFGVGLSPERFNTIYRNIGSSTKRQSNSMIGGFGIGRFSSLAYSDIVYVTSNYDGIKYKYLMYKDGSKISIDLLNQNFTTESNGVEVQIPVKRNDLYSFYREIKKQLVYFENLYFIDNTDRFDINASESYNDFKIKKYNHFLVNTLTENKKSPDIVIGKVRYSLNSGFLSQHFTVWEMTLPITLIFDIGEIKVTPNREEIIYNDVVSKRIIDKFKLAIEEVKDLITVSLTKNYISVDDYYTACKNINNVSLLEYNNFSVNVGVPSSENCYITLNSVHYKPTDFTYIYDKIYLYNFFKPDYRLDGGRLLFRKSNKNLNHIKEHFKETFICDVGKLNNISKSYIKDHYDSKCIILKKENFYLSALKKFLKDNDSVISEKYKDSFKVIFKVVAANLKKIKEIDNKSIPQSYILKLKEEAKHKRLDNKSNNSTKLKQEITIYKLRKSDKGWHEVTTDSESLSLEGLKSKYKSLVVYGIKGDERLKDFYNITKSSGKIAFLELSETKLKLVKEFGNFVNIENLMSVKYKQIRKIGTAALILELVPKIKKLSELHNLQKINKELYNTVNLLNNYVNTNFKRTGKFTEEKLVRDILKLCKEKRYFDESVKAILMTNLSKIKSCEFMLLLHDNSYSSFGIQKVNFITDYILARKLFRPDVEAVKKLRKETILNLNDENNQD